MDVLEQSFLWLLFVVRSFSMLVVFSSMRAYLKMSGMLVLSATLALFMLSFASVPETVSATLRDSNIIAFVLLVLCEGAIGLSIGLPLALSLECLPMAARAADVSRGAQFGEQLNPNLGVNLSPFESIALLAALVFVFVAGGYQFGIELLTASVTATHQSGTNVGSFIFDRGAIMGMISLSAKAIALGISIAAPVILFSFFLDLAASVLSRALQRINVVFELLPAKLLLGTMIFAYACLSLDISGVVGPALKLSAQLAGVGYGG